MSIRLRLTLVIVLIGLIPVALLLFVANRNSTDLQTLVVNTNQSIISQAPIEVAQTLNLLNNQVAERINGLTTQLLFVGSLTAVIAIILGILLGTTITVPIRNMARAADKAAQGYHEAFQPLDDSSELGMLSRSIYAMTLQLSEGMENLEQQATELIRESSRRNDQLEVAAHIGREVSTILDINILLDEVAQLISERFGYYHVGIYIVDDVGEYAVLRAANSIGGKKLLAQGYKLKIGETGIVGYVAKHGKARVAFDAASDQAFSLNPELSDTRSEAAVPLRIRDHVMGILDVQSIILSAFSMDDLRILQIVADQVALTIENTRLFAENRRIKNDLEHVHGQRVIGSWKHRLQNAPVTYVFNRLGVESNRQLADGGFNNSLPYSPTIDDEINQLNVPITIREELIGTLILRREAGSNKWTQDELEIVQDVIEQIGPALESARLLEEAQARAMREQAVNVIATQVRSSIGMDAILQNTVRELGKALGSSRTFIQLDVESSGEQQG